MAAAAGRASCRGGPVGGCSCVPTTTSFLNAIEVRPRCLERISRSHVLSLRACAWRAMAGARTHDAGLLHRAAASAVVSRLMCAPELTRVCRTSRYDAAARLPRGSEGC